MPFIIPIHRVELRVFVFSSIFIIIIIIIS